MHPPLVAPAAGVLDADVRIEPGTGGGDGVDGHVGVGRQAVGLAVLLGPAVDVGQQGLVVGAEVGGARGEGVVAVTGGRGRGRKYCRR